MLVDPWSLEDSVDWSPDITAAHTTQQADRTNIRPIAAKDFKSTFLYNFFPNNKHIFNQCTKRDKNFRIVSNDPIYVLAFTLFRYIEEISDVMNFVDHVGAIHIKFECPNGLGLYAEQTFQTETAYVAVFDENYSEDFGLHDKNRKLLFFNIGLSDLSYDVHHSNLLCIDKVNKQIEVYEPHGVMHFSHHVNNVLKDLFKGYMNAGYQLVTPGKLSLLFSEGSFKSQKTTIQIEADFMMDEDGRLQRNNGFCFYWTLLVTLARIYVYKNFTSSYWVHYQVYQRPPPYAKDFVYSDMPLKVIDYLQRKVCNIFSSGEYHSLNILNDAAEAGLTGDKVLTKRQTETLSIRDFTSYLMQCFSNDTPGILFGVQNAMTDMYIKSSIPLRLAVMMYMESTASDYIIKSTVHPAGSYRLVISKMEVYQNKEAVKVLTINKFKYKFWLGKEYKDYLDDERVGVWFDEVGSVIKFSRNKFTANGLQYKKNVNNIFYESGGNRQS
jgi:hypothetical protein